MILRIVVRDFLRILDPDDYYPIYGDDSVRNYDAQNSNQKFYMFS